MLITKKASISVTRTITTTKIIAMTATFDFTITSLTKSVRVLDPINMF